MFRKGSYFAGTGSCPFPVKIYICIIAKWLRKHKLRGGREKSAAVNVSLLAENSVISRLFCNRSECRRMNQKGIPPI